MNKFAGFVVFAGSCFVIVDNIFPDIGEPQPTLIILGIFTALLGIILMKKG